MNGTKIVGDDYVDTLLLATMDIIHRRAASQYLASGAAKTYHNTFAFSNVQFSELWYVNDTEEVVSAALMKIKHIVEEMYLEQNGMRFLKNQFLLYKALMSIDLLYTHHVLTDAELKRIADARHTYLTREFFKQFKSVCERVPIIGYPLYSHDVDESEYTTVGFIKLKTRFLAILSIFGSMEDESYPETSEMPEDQDQQKSNASSNKDILREVLDQNNQLLRSMQDMQSQINILAESLEKNQEIQEELNGI